jgi:hypothetical protein
VKSISPELKVAHEELTAAIEKVIALDPDYGGPATEDDPMMALDFLIVVFGRTMSLADQQHSSYTYICKDGGLTTPVHHLQGLAKRLWDWANQDSEVPG